MLRTILAFAATLAGIPVTYAQVNPLDFVTVVPITDNNATTNELGRDRVAINSTSFKNESIITIGDYQFTANYRDDGKLMVMRRDLTAPTNDWDIHITEFTSFNINDAHNVPVIGIDGDGYLHLAWGTHGNPLLYSRSTTPVTSGQTMNLIGDTVGNSGAINTMTGSNETGTTYPNFVRIRGSDDLLFNYRTGGSGNGTYRITRYNTASQSWLWADQTWIANTDPSGLTYNAYPHNMSYDTGGGLHASWTYRYNSSSPTGHSGYQTNHNLFYAYSPDNGATWYKDIAGTIPYPVDINEQNSQIIVDIPEGSSLINTGTQAVDAHDRPAIATWWAPHAYDPVPDHRRQYMYVGHNGTDWFTSQITHRRSDPNSPVPESNLGANHMGRPQIVFDDYNRAYVIYKDKDNGGSVTVAYSQAESRDDWEFIQLTTTDLGYYEPTLDRTLWDSSRQMHILVQKIDGNSSNGGSPLEIIEWDTASAMGRVLKWTGQHSPTWDTTAVNFTDLGMPDNFDSFDHITFDGSSAETTVHFAGNVDAGKVVVDSSGAYTFSGPGALTSGSLAVVGGGSLELATSGNTYTGQTRVSGATLQITGDATAMTSKMVAADGGTLIVDSSDASTMSSSFEVWPTGVLEVGSATSTGNVFPDNPMRIINDGLIRVKTTEILRNVTGLGTIEAAAGTTTLQSNPNFQGGVHVRSGATLISADASGLGTGQFGDVIVEDGGQLRLDASGALFQDFNISGEGGGAGAVQIAASVDITFDHNLSVNSLSSTLDIGPSATATVKRGITGAGGLTKQGSGTLFVEGNNTYSGRTIVRDGVLVVDRSTGFGETIVDPGGVLEACGMVRGDLNALGGSVVRINSSGAAINGVLFQDDFSGPGGPLNGTMPDTSFNGSIWVAAPTFEDDGDSVKGTAGGTATLAFTPVDGSTYVLKTSIQNITGDTDWFALAFANGQSAANSSNARLITGDVEGLAWALYRGAQSGTTTNQTFLGDTSVEPNSGTQDGAAWLTDGTTAAGNVDLRIILDTTGGAGSWTVTMEADTGSGFQVIRATETLNDEAINSVGIANSNSADLTGTITSFSLTTDVSTPDLFEARTLTVEGDFTLDPGATLEMELLDTNDHDRLRVVGTFSVGGNLVVSFTEGAPLPIAGDTFDLIEFGAFVGDFESIVLPALNGGLLFDIVQDVSSASLLVRYAADFDADGDVDGDDFLVWRASFGATIGGDADGDQDTDGDDFLIWQAQYGSVAGTRSMAVPEPSTMIIGSAMAWILGIAAQRRSTQKW